MMQEAAAPDHFRLFVAIQVPEAIKDSIAEAQGRLRGALPSSAARWSTREQFHLTLKFLGNVEAQRLGALADGLRLACAGFAPLQLRAETVGFFPNARAPRVVWVGVADLDGRLGPLQSAVEEACRGFTAEHDEKKFTGHVTLGRFKFIRRPEAETVAKEAERFSRQHFGEWLAREVHVIRSELSPKVARYSSLAECPLSGSAAGKA